jgi:hypothetical protein
LVFGCGNWPEDIQCNAFYHQQLVWKNHDDTFALGPVVSLPWGNTPSGVGHRAWFGIKNCGDNGLGYDIGFVFVNNNNTLANQRVRKKKWRH